MAATKQSSRHGYIGVKEYADQNSIPERQVRRACAKGWIVGAIKAGGPTGKPGPREWRIPRMAAAPLNLAPKRRYRSPELYDGISVREWAKRCGRSRWRAYKVLNKGLVEGAHYGPYGWDVPEGAPWPIPEGAGGFQRKDTK